MTPYEWACASNHRDAANELNAAGLLHKGEELLEPVSFMPCGSPVYALPKHLKSAVFYPSKQSTTSDGRPAMRIRSAESAHHNELMKACAEGNVEHIERLVKGCAEGQCEGCDVEAFDHLGWRPIQLAASTGQVDSVRALVRLGANVHAPDSQGNRALYWAAHDGRAEAVRVLVELGAEMEHQGNETAAMHEAAEAGHLAVMRTLAELGASVEAAGYLGFRPLHMAMHKGQHAAMRVLVKELGADVESQTLEGSRALHFAAVKVGLTSA
jgi:ankyrin repeat protein